MWLALYFYNTMKGKVAFLHPEVGAEVASEHRHRRSLHPEELSVEQHLPPERGWCHLLTASLTERKTICLRDLFLSLSGLLLLYLGLPPCLLPQTTTHISSRLFPPIASATAANSRSLFLSSTPLTPGLRWHSEGVGEGRGG